MSNARNVAPLPTLASGGRGVRRVQLSLYDERPRGGEVVQLEGPPTTRAECAAIAKPCTRACRHNTGITMAEERPGRRWDKPMVVRDTWTPELAGCSLDQTVSEPDGMLLDEVGAHLGITGEAVRVTEERALRKLRKRLITLAAREGVTVEELLASLIGYP